MLFRSYAAQMVLGTAQLALQSDQHTAAMKDAVCSPGGTTIAGVRALERGGFRSAAMEAVIAAYEKTLALKSCPAPNAEALRTEVCPPPGDQRTTHPPFSGQKRPTGHADGAFETVEKTPSFSGKRLAVCCAHNLCAIGAQIPHLQPEKYFLSRIYRERK